MPSSFTPVLVSYYYGCNCALCRLKFASAAREKRGPFTHGASSFTLYQGRIDEQHGKETTSLQLPKH